MITRWSHLTAYGGSVYLLFLQLSSWCCWITCKPTGRIARALTDRIAILFPGGFKRDWPPLFAFFLRKEMPISTAEFAEGTEHLCFSTLGSLSCACITHTIHSLGWSNPAPSPPPNFLFREGQSELWLVGNTWSLKARQTRREMEQEERTPVWHPVLFNWGKCLHLRLFGGKTKWRLNWLLSHTAANLCWEMEKCQLHC